MYYHNSASANKIKIFFNLVNGQNQNAYDVWNQNNKNNT